MKKKIWFITGISSGLGKALAETILQKGEYVIGTFRKQEQVDQYNKLHQGNAEAYLLDITNYEQLENIVASIYQRLGRIDVLVNNAGLGFVGAVEESSLKEIKSVFEANVFGTLKLTQEVLPIMRKQKQGFIIQISSHAGVKAFPGFGIYNATKFALEGFSEALAAEIAPLGLQLTIVEPGPFRTNFAGASLQAAQNTIPDYSETAGAFKEKLLSVNGKQEGHPQKAAEAIYNHTLKKNPTLRLPLGKTPLTTIQLKIDSLQFDLNENKEVSELAIF